ncbi:MAG: BrnT family toxin [Candidatus Atribacteria bacterium]|nr:BrnT family toxin [Candidatus Atribacteria bacterium]
MKQILWDSDKNALLFKDRGVCFEDILSAMEQGAVLDIIDHPNQTKYPGQRMMIVQLGRYAYLVPYIETEEYLFLKTIIPSRKATKTFLRSGGDNHETDER